AVVNLNLATDESYKDRQTGQLVPKTEWHRIVMFGKIAEVAGQYLRKGSKVFLQGRLSTDRYEKDGQTHYATKIILPNFGATLLMLDRKPEEGGA
ncbi:MAG: single-stranded DNA-binding protein, partial [Parvibaculum sp.]